MPPLVSSRGSRTFSISSRDSGVEDDDARFTVEVSIGGEIWGSGTGRTKRAAERNAAREALARTAPGDG